MSQVIYQACNQKYAFYTHQNVSRVISVRVATFDLFWCTFFSK